MYSLKAILFSFSANFIFLGIFQIQAKAQLLPDNTLGAENSVVNSINSLEDRINSGAIRGTNLFHSFKEFNIDSGKSVYFNNPNNIQNILTRVTGDNQSQIMGKLGVLGNANLFLINPKGIIFGKDASLDINGSFVGSTASLINFADRTQFSAVSPGDKPLLTISTPIGLGMGNNPGEIRVQGEGNKLSASRLSSPFRDNGTEGLEIKPGKTIALIGSNIILEGGSLKTNSGNIELGSVDSGQVDFSLTPQNLEFSYDRVENFQDIKLLKESSLQVNSFSKIPNIENSGSIQLQGKQISLQDGSVIFTNNQVDSTSGIININATESLELIDTNINGSQPTSLRSQALFTGQGGDIKISTKQLTIENGGAISAYDFGSNSGGNIEIKASDFVKVIGVSETTSSPSTIITNVFNSGNGGNIEISTNRFTSLNGSTISSSTFGSGDAGNLTINARESVEVIGINPKSLQKSFVTSITLGTGNGSNVIVNTQRVIVKDGGRIDASTIGSGAAGNITINATEKVELSGFIPEFIIPSQITSSANIADQSIQQRFGFPAILKGESGTVTINTSQLNIADGAVLAVKNEGSGNAGKLTVKANYININNQGNISAATASGEGGDIDLQTNNLLLQNNSNISATSAGKGNGGNISIETQILTALQNSDITANSEGSVGGRVVINAKGVFGTQFREFLTPESDITATSGLGSEFNGVVDINTITTTPNSGLIELPKNLADSSKQIAAGCSAVRGNTFTISGRGGLPENPSQLFVDNNPIVNLVNLVTPSEKQIISSKISSINNHKKEIIEARGWITDAEGNIEFVAEAPQLKDNSGVISQVNCQLISSN